MGGGGRFLDVPSSSPPDSGTPSTVDNRPQEAPISGLAIMRQRIGKSGVDAPLAEFITGSIRKSSIQTYESAIISGTFYAVRIQRVLL